MEGERRSVTLSLSGRWSVVPRRRPAMQRGGLSGAVAGGIRWRGGAGVGYIANMKAIGELERRIRGNVDCVRERVDAALARSGRSNESVTLVAVTKTFGADVVDAVVRAGIADVGENRVQEFLAKRDAVREACRWHLVGHLQRNKASKVVGAVECIHSVDDVRLARAIDRLARQRDLTVRVFLQVNTSGEAAKSGVAPETAVEAAVEVSSMPGIDLAGLMTIGRRAGGERETRSCFAALRTLRQAVNAHLDHPIVELSMGMSGDFEWALEEGATVIRLGRVLTGERDR